MTAEELAEIRKKHEFLEMSVTRLSWSRMEIDRAALLTHTDAQAQRIAELEAQLAARGPTREAIYTAIEEYCYVARDPKDDLSYIVAGKYQAADAILSLPASGALATAHAEQRPSAFTRDQLVEMSARVKAATDAMSRDTKIDPIDALKVYGAAATAQAVTLTWEDRLVVENARNKTIYGWDVPRLIAIIDRLTNGASTP